MSKRTDYLKILGSRSALKQNKIMENLQPEETKTGGIPELEKETDEENKDVPNNEVSADDVRFF